MSQPYIDFGYVKEHANFETVLRHYNLVLTGRGKNRTVSCPFHRDQRPSCKIELERRIFHCFGCGAKGNILEFVGKLEKTDLRGAAIKVAEICSISLAPPRSDRGKPTLNDAPEPAQAPPPAPTSRSDPGPVNPPLTFVLKLDPQHPYLAERGLSAEIVAAFGLGFCSRGLMGGRICIPIHDADGNLVAYAGRWPGEDVPEGEGKYKLPPKFEKTRVLFNLHRVSDPTHLVLVEGYWSAIRLHTLGIPTAALMGSLIAPEQIALLQERGTRSVVLLMDGDDAGQKARERALPALASTFFIYAPVLPDGEKPDTLDEATLRELVAAPDPFS